MMSNAKQYQLVFLIAVLALGCLVNVALGSFFGIVGVIYFLFFGSQTITIDNDKHRLN